MTQPLRQQAMSEQAMEDLIKSIGIPARPSLLADVQQEISSPSPEPRKIAKLVSQDVAMSASLIKAANSVFFGLQRKVESVEQAASFLGLNQCASILLGLVVRKMVDAEGPQLVRYWDVSMKRSLAMTQIAKRLRVCAPDVAHTFGLFCDIGIPMLMKRFPDYVETLKIANSDVGQIFTQIEDDRHSTNHATIGAIMSRGWGLSVEVTHAIRVHHDYDVMGESIIPRPVKTLVAMGLVAERVIQTYRGLNHHVEWEKGGDMACSVLNLSDDDVTDCCEALHGMFSEME